MVSNHRVPVYMLLIISIVCFIFRFKREPNQFNPTDRPSTAL